MLQNNTLQVATFAPTEAIGHCFQSDRKGHLSSTHIQFHTHKAALEAASSYSRDDPCGHPMAWVASGQASALHWSSIHIAYEWMTLVIRSLTLVQKGRNELHPYASVSDLSIPSTSSSSASSLAASASSSSCRL